MRPACWAPGTRRRAASAATTNAGPAPCRSRSTHDHDDGASRLRRRPEPGRRSGDRIGGRPVARVPHGEGPDRSSLCAAELAADETCIQGAARPWTAPFPRRSPVIVIPAGRWGVPPRSSNAVPGRSPSVGARQAAAPGPLPRRGARRWPSCGRSSPSQAFTSARSWSSVSTGTTLASSFGGLLPSSGSSRSSRSSTSHAENRRSARCGSGRWRDRRRSPGCRRRTPPQCADRG
jgi:hypothetical protein